MTSINPPVASPAPISGFTTILGVTINPMAIVLVLLLAVIAWLVYQAQRSHAPFDIRELIKDDVTGKISVTKTTFFSAFLMTSWVIVDLEIKARLTDTLFGGYLLAWVGPLTAKVIFNKDSFQRIDPKNELKDQ